jgi:outer membrane protein assembly factor BamD
VLRHNWGRAAVTIVALTCALALSACAGKSRKPALHYEERPVEQLYAAGAERLDHHQWLDAVDYFREVERQHPYSEWARRAVLMTAYAHYQANQYNDAIDDSDRFLSLYPGNPSAVYAFYLKSICYFEQITDVGRDQGYTEQAQAAFRDVITRYPKSEYALDARLKTDMVKDQLAGKEMTVGRYYLREGQTLAAIGRFRTVIDKYQTTSHTPEALYRMVEAYLTIGLLDEARRNGAVLGYNFPGDPWYADAYKLLTSRGLRPAVPPLEKGAKKSFLDRLIQGKGHTLPPPSAADSTTPAADAPDGSPAPTLDTAAPDASPATPPAPEPKKKKKGFFHRILHL